MHAAQVQVKDLEAAAHRDRRSSRLYQLLTVRCITSLQGQECDAGLWHPSRIFWRALVAVL